MSLESIETITISAGGAAPPCLPLGAAVGGRFGVSGQDCDNPRVDYAQGSHS